MDRLSELEGTVLGIVWSDSPITRYAIRTRFLNSRSSHFSGSSGAVYPLVARLLASGLLSAEQSQQGKRPRTLYRLTQLGERSLRDWIVNVEGWMAAVEFDPIRARVFFLASLPKRSRRKFLREAGDRLDAEITETITHVKALTETKDTWAAWGARGALGVLRARRKWLREIEADES